MLKRIFLFTALLATLAAISQASHAARKYPTRPITNTVVWGAGGGTDAVNRMLMAEMSKILGVRINVTNKTGGVAGSIGMSQVLKKRPDGYNLVGISSSNVTASVNGGWRERFNVWSPFIFGGSPEVISVRANSPYKTLDDLIKAAKAKPGSIKVSASGAGGIHHLYLLELAKATGTKFQFIPYPGSAPSQNAAVTGEVDVVITSMAEQAQLIKGKKIRPLGMLDPNDFHLKGYGVIKSTFPSYPSLNKNLPIPQAIGFAVNNKATEAVKQKLASAFEEALTKPAVKKWAEDNFYVITGEHGEEARKEFDRFKSFFSWALYDLGSTKESPEKFSIAKP